VRLVSYGAAGVQRSIREACSGWKLQAGTREE
jgi:hypothetical protein